MELRNLLTVLPILLSTFLIIGYVSLNRSSPSLKRSTELAVRPLEGSISTDSSTCSCPTDTLNDDCRNTAYPVMGGLDFVQYFTSFKNSDGTYDETKVGSVGSSSFSYVYKGYTFYFLNQENLDAFAISPQSYVPQYGGFCTWGITGETCPPYAWSADCLGPNGSYSHWTIFSGKLYFFKSSSPKSKFLAAAADYVSTGDNNWKTWFNEADQFSTLCYSS